VSSRSNPQSRNRLRSDNEAQENPPPQTPRHLRRNEGLVRRAGCGNRHWPNVVTKPFFGFTALYRGDKLFGLLPRTRAMQTANSLVFKLESPGPQASARMQRDSRVGAAVMQKARWFTFELSTDVDLHDALDWLARGYEAAGKREKRGAK
jgi:hypothetical protein